MSAEVGRLRRNSGKLADGDAPEWVYICRFIRDLISATSPPEQEVVPIDTLLAPDLAATREMTLAILDTDYSDILSVPRLS